jgi:uncharacterized protein
MTITAPNGELAVPPADALHLTWDNVYESTLALASTIESHCVETGEYFDKMLLVPRGSYYLGNIVSREMDFGATDILHACLSSYEDGQTERRGDFEYGQMPTPEEVKGKNLLLIEEVCDSGNTLHHLRGLLDLAGAGLVRTGVLHYKPEKSKTGFVPDWFVEKTNQWIVYPWEEHERRGKLSVVRQSMGARAVSQASN